MKSGNIRVVGGILGSIILGIVGLAVTRSGAPRAQEADGRAAPEVTRGAAPFRRVRPSSTQLSGLSKIKHFVFIVKENRSFDDFFGTFAGADDATMGTTSTGQVIPLNHESDKIARDLDHSWTYSITAVDGGKMDKWDVTTFPLFPCNLNGDYACYSQLHQADIPNYWSYAQTYALGDHMFASLHGPSFPNHLYTVAAQSNGIITNVPLSPGQWGCDAPQGSTAELINSKGLAANEFPCFDFTTLADSLQAAGISWKYYSPSIGFTGYTYNALDAVNHIRNT